MREVRPGLASIGFRAPLINLLHRDTSHGVTDTTSRKRGLNRSVLDGLSSLEGFQISGARVPAEVSSRLALAETLSFQGRGLGHATRVQTADAATSEGGPAPSAHVAGH